MQIVIVNCFKNIAIQSDRQEEILGGVDQANIGKHPVCACKATMANGLPLFDLIIPNEIIFLLLLKAPLILSVLKQQRSIFILLIQRGMFVCKN